MKSVKECLLVDKEAVYRLKEEAKKKLESASLFDRIIGVETVRILNELGLLDMRVEK